MIDKTGRIDWAEIWPESIDPELDYAKERVEWEEEHAQILAEDDDDAREPA
jgi:hypothetical protein